MATYATSPRIYPFTAVAAAKAVTGGPVSIFTTTVGRVLLRGLYGSVSTVIGAGATTLQLQLNPTAAGANTVLCAVSTSIATFAVSSLVSITGVVTDAMVLNGTTQGAIRDMTVPLVLQPGVIELVIVGGTTGAIDWGAIWSPYDAGALLA